MSLTLTPLVGLAFAGSCATENDEIAPGAASFGTPVWGPPALLANLELRLGLPTPDVVDAVRVQRLALKLDQLTAARPRFYARSFATDRLGTATALLAMRDELVTAGWDGEPLAGGGERLDTFAALETGYELPAGDGDRLRRVEAELRSASIRPFDELRLAEPITAWPGRWQRVFRLLGERGVSVRVRHAQVSFEALDSDCDLARVQSALRGEDHKPGSLRGDGSLVLLRGETSWELGPAVAALLRAWADPRAVVVRGGDVSALDGALTAAGLGSQGLDSPTAWRPMLQVLPLAIELAFEPRDPYRVLELLTLPLGPFHGFVGGALARALAAAPGIGGRPWRHAKEYVAQRVGADDTRAIEKIEAWLEAPGHSAREGVPRSALLAIADRVVTWLTAGYALARKQADTHAGDRGRATRAAVTGAALAQAQGFREALAHDARDTLDVVDARLLIEQVSSQHALPLVEECAGRIDAADSPALLRVRRDTVVWWHCVAETEWRPYPRAWRKYELDALRSGGVLLADRAARLSAEGAAWRQVVTGARHRLVLVVPRRASSEALEPHPIIHEIMARLGARDEDVARISVEARDLLANHGQSIATTNALSIVDLHPLVLPEARVEWRVAAGSFSPPSEYSATSLQELVGCPLSWVLARGARLRAGSLTSIPKGPLLHGTLGHRVVEELHHAGALSRPEDVSARFADVFERLLLEEATVLRRPGMTFELAQLRVQLERSLRTLSGLLAAAQLRVVDVESRIAVEWRGRTLVGHLDLLLQDANGADVVLDIKWGGSRYGDLLKKGRSIQLAVYVASRRLVTRATHFPRAAYFSLKQGKALSTETLFADVRPLPGPSLEETWSKLERTVDRVERVLAAGRIPVTGVSRSLPMLETVGVEPSDIASHLDIEKERICDYCSFDAICGKRWQAFS